MSDRIQLAGITAEVLERAQSIFAETREGERQEIWNSKRIPAFVSPLSRAPLAWFPYIMVASFEAADLDPIRNKIAQVDPLGRRRLVTEE